MSSLSTITPDNQNILLVCLSLFTVLIYYRLRHRTGLATTALSGPPNPSFFFGVYQLLNDADEPASIYDAWTKAYGPAFKVPFGFGSSRIVITDPKANAHFYSRETFGYVQTKLSRVFIENLFGRGLLWAEGESHKRQRKALSPAFSNAAIRKLTSVFFDSAYKMKSIWDTQIDSNDGKATIDVQVWMNHISLDSIGIAGFGYDFQALSSSQSARSKAVVDVFDSFGNNDSSFLSRLVFLLGPVFPILQKLPTKQNRMLKKLKTTMRGIADGLLEKNRDVSSISTQEKSIIGLLIKAESSASSLSMTQEEILAQNVLLLAGYETTSISLTWALIELARKPAKQETLRDEIDQAYSHGVDPTFDQLSTSLPYLDAVVHEVLRLHPPVMETTRIAAEDDTIPFTDPIKTATGERVSQLFVSKGTVITSPIRYINRAEAFWGPDAGEFVPERWLNTSDSPSNAATPPRRSQEIQGHRHLLTFSDGPRICLGKSIALTEFKAVLAVLIRNYTFDLPSGPETIIEKHPSILPRPRVAGEKGPCVPMIIQRVEN